MTPNQQRLVENAIDAVAQRTIVGEDARVVRYLVKQLEDPARVEDHVYFADTLRRRLESPNHMVHV